MQNVVWLYSRHMFLQWSPSSLLRGRRVSSLTSVLHKPWNKNAAGPGFIPTTLKLLRQRQVHPVPFRQWRVRLDMSISATEDEMMLKYTKKYTKISRDDRRKFGKEQSTLREADSRSTGQELLLLVRKPKCSQQSVPGPKTKPSGSTFHTILWIYIFSPISLFWKNKKWGLWHHLAVCCSLCRSVCVSLLIFVKIGDLWDYLALCVSVCLPVCLCILSNFFRFLCDPGRIVESGRLVLRGTPCIIPHLWPGLACMLHTSTYIRYRQAQRHREVKQGETEWNGMEEQEIWIPLEKSMEGRVRIYIIKIKLRQYM
jgi:hypothetical protein